MSYNRSRILFCSFTYVNFDFLQSQAPPVERLSIVFSLGDPLVFALAPVSLLSIVFKFSLWPTGKDWAPGFAAHVGFPIIHPSKYLLLGPVWCRLAHVMYSIIGCRIVLHLQEAARSPYYVETNLSSLFFSLWTSKWHGRVCRGSPFYWQRILKWRPLAIQ